MLFDELWHEEKPGLSSYADQPELAAQSVRKLIQLAKGNNIERRTMNLEDIFSVSDGWIVGIFLTAYIKSESWWYTMAQNRLNSIIRTVRT